MYQDEIYHYGVKGMKWHQHLKRHEEPLLDRLGRDEKKDLEEAKQYQQYVQDKADEDKRHASRQFSRAREYERRAGGIGADEMRADARNSMRWNKFDQELADSEMRKVKIAQWHYDKTVMGKIDKGKRKVAEFLKKGFKR